MASYPVHHVLNHDHVFAAVAGSHAQPSPPPGLILLLFLSNHHSWMHGLTHGPWQCVFCICCISDAWEQFVPFGEIESEFTFAETRSKWALGETYRLAPINRTFGFIDDPNSEALPITYALSWATANSPHGFYIDGSSGEVFLQVCGEHDRCRV